MRQGMTNKKKDKRDNRLIVVTGLAGAGSSTALNILEDIGFLAVDNLPLALVGQLIGLEIETAGRKVAVSIDGRTSGFDSASLSALVGDARRRLDDQMMLVYLTASQDELYRRYNATRRQHPVSHDDMDETLMDVIERDSSKMEAVESLADVVIDTTGVAPKQFRQELLDRIGVENSPFLPVEVISFSYRKGLPHTADMVLDVRFIENPHWQPELAAMTGADEPVQAFIDTDPSFGRFIDSTIAMLDETLPRYALEGRARFAIAMGCTGGRHRSVYAAIIIAGQLEKKGFPVSLSHREI
jgi:UPF0042 nucleotide-binding protein